MPLRRGSGPHRIFGVQSERVRVSLPALVLRQSFPPPVVQVGETFVHRHGRQRGRGGDLTGDLLGPLERARVDRGRRDLPEVVGCLARLGSADLVQRHVQPPAKPNRDVHDGATVPHEMDPTTSAGTRSGGS